MTGVIYIHGQGGNISEAGHYQTLLPDFNITGFDYKADTPFEARDEFSEYLESFSSMHERIIIIANSLGAYFIMNVSNAHLIDRAYFISPVVDMESIIKNIMACENITERELKLKHTIKASSGIILSWDYLSWVRANPISWRVQTSILYGEHDNIQALETIKTFSRRIGADLTIMKGGEHYFHTDEQMKFLDRWLLRSIEL